VKPSILVINKRRISLSFLNRLLGRDRDVTRNWIAQPEHELIFDLDRLSVGGTRLVDPFDSLSWLGPPTERLSEWSQYRWHRHGFVVGGEGAICYFYLVWRGGVEEVGLGYEPFSRIWTFMRNGEPVPVGEQIQREELDDLLGVKGEFTAEGEKQDVDNRISGAEYNGTDVFYQFEDELRQGDTVDAFFDEDGLLCLIRVL
jgi:hypothetical protein